MRPAIREVELVDELLTKGQRVQLGGGTINESHIEVIEFGPPILLPSATTNRYSCARSQRANAPLIASASAH